MRRPTSSALALCAAALLCGCATTTPGNTRAGSAIDTNAYVDAIAGFDDYDRPPRLLSGKAPVYPIREGLAQRTGSVTLSFTIGEDGRTRDIAVTGGSGEPFASHAILAVRDWVYAPAMKDGKPVAVTVEQTIGFGDGVPYFGSREKDD